MELDTVIKKRRIIRKYRNQTVDKKLIKQIIEAGIEAPSWKNSQTARYHIVNSKEALDAFHQHDLNHALEVKKMDIKMDELFDQVKKDIIQMIKESNDKGDLTINFLMIAKYFERIGDHVVNICEWIEFNQTGKLNNTRLI